MTMQAKRSAVPASATGNWMPPTAPLGILPRKKQKSSARMMWHRRLPSVTARNWIHWYINRRWIQIIITTSLMMPCWVRTLPKLCRTQREISCPRQVPPSGGKIVPKWLPHMRQTILEEMSRKTQLLKNTRMGSGFRLMRKKFFWYTMKMEMSARPRQRAGKRGIRTGSPG